MDTTMEQLRAVYLSALPERVAELEDAHELLLCDRPRGLQEIRRLAHRLHGTGASYGFADVSVVASELEEAAPAQVSPALERLVMVLKRIGAPGRTTTVLAIDDDPLGLALLRRRLGGSERVVLTAATARAALELLEREPIDLVVLDLRLPDMDGRQLLSQLRGSPRTQGVPIFVVSAAHDAAAQCFALGADNFFRKPVDLNVLVSAVRGHLARGGSSTRTFQVDAWSLVADRAQLEGVFARQAGRAFALAVVELDRSPEWDATLDRAVHELALRHVGGGLTKALGLGAVVGCWDRDQLVVLFPRSAGPQALQALAAAQAALARSTFATPGGRALTASFSAGVTDVPPGTDLETAVAAACSALDERRAALESEATPAAGPAAEASPQARRRALLVDDDPAVAALLRPHLSSLGLELVHAASGSVALERARREVFDLFLLDVNMPGLDGFEVLRQLRAQPGLTGVPIVILSAAGRERSVTRGFELRADDYVVKPFQPGVLMARLRRLLPGPPRPVAAPLQVGTMAGSFAGHQLVEFVQMLALNRKTGLLRIASDRCRGQLAVREGCLIGASLRDLTGLEAARDLLGMRYGTFEFGPGLAEEQDQGLRAPLEGLLLGLLARRESRRCSRPA